MKIDRQAVFNKFDGHCAYTGKPLDDKWQVDHVNSKYRMSYMKIGNPNAIENLLPAIRIVNHYKRSHDLEGFRNYMRTFHIRLSNLPKKTNVEATKKRIIYMNTIADLFGITPNKPFKGIFYFETK